MPAVRQTLPKDGGAPFLRRIAVALADYRLEAVLMADAAAALQAV